MAHGASYTVKYRRRRSRKTDYKRRLNLLKGGKPRLVVRRSNTHMLVQVIEYNQDGDRVIASAHSGELRKMGWTHSTSNMPAAYLTGLLCGKKASNKKTSTVSADLGMASLVRGGIVYAAIKGAIDGGLDVPADETVFPKQERISGQHISDHAKKSKDIQKDTDSLKKRILEGK